MDDLVGAARTVRKVGLGLRQLDISVRNHFLRTLADRLSDNRERIHQSNLQDLREAQASGLSPALLKRLEYNPQKIQESAQGLRALADLPDPIEKVLQARLLDEGLELFQVSVPIGVIAMIFESRPDALIQMAGLCWKSGNGVILKGGREALHTNETLMNIILTSLQELGLPQGWIHLAKTREDVQQLLQLDKLIDLIIPRGSNEFVRYIMDHTRIPVLGHADGIVHLYLHADAPLELALPLVVDSKTQYVAVCNALETLLVHREAAQGLLPGIVSALQEKKVRLKGCPLTREIVPHLEPAQPEDWDTEYLDYVLSIKMVSSIEEAIDHINTHGSHHTDAIVTLDPEAARHFFQGVDSADVFWNASTRFSDGYRFGLGAEVGIATGKLHARGPMGLEGLVTYQWRLRGTGQIVADYSSGKRAFRHQDMDPATYLKIWKK